MWRRNKESGQALVFGVATLGILLIGIAGLGVDMGYYRYQKRLMQTAADAAAIAGASDLAYGGWSTAAQNAAASSGFTDASSNTLSTCTNDVTTSSSLVGTVCVQVSSPPTSGPHSTDATHSYVEAIVSVVEPTFFMKLLGTNSEPVTARAVATALSGSSTNTGCLYTLGPPSNKIEGVNIQGSAEINAPTCGIMDNGNYDPTGGTQNLIINAGTFGVAGADTGHGGSVTCYDQSSTNCPSFNEPAVSNPYTGMVAPTQPAASASCAGFSGCNVSTSGTTTLQPGTYSSIDFGKNSVTTLASGIYYINGTGGVTFEGKATVSDPGNGVMFYFTCPVGTSPCSNGATLNAVGGGNVPDLQLTAPSPTNCAACPSQYDGILFYQDPNDTNPPSLGGDNNTTLNGVLYFPTVELNFFGNASFSAGIVVTQALSVTGNPTVTLLGAAGLPTGVNFVKNAVLVE